MINNDLVVFEDKRFKISCGDDIFKRIKRIKINYEQENFLVFFLDVKNKLKKYEIIAKGGIDSCVVCPNTIFRRALLNNSNHIIIAHNHPSNDLKESYEDREVFNKLKEAGNIINIKVLDSIIFNKKGFYSVMK